MTQSNATRRTALFLDRDGVLDDLVFHADTGGWEAPRNADEVRLRPRVREALRRAADAGWLIFVVSNQPDAAKRRTSMRSLKSAHARLVRLLEDAPIADFFYCFHRAEEKCRCRKPKPYFVMQAAERYGIDLAQSWFVGDNASDIECGRRAGTRTALIDYEHSAEKRGQQRADLVCRDLAHFVRLLTARKSVP